VYIQHRIVYASEAIVKRCLRCMRQLLFMAALRSRCGYYIFGLWLLLSSLYTCLLVKINIYQSSIFFHRLSSAVAGWMSTILSHLVWP